MCENPVESYKTPIKDALTTNCCATCFCGFFSPIILEVPGRTLIEGVGLPKSFVNDISTTNKEFAVANERIDKSHWICDYADDIFQTLRETELKRYKICFRSQQCGFRPALLRLLKVASEKHNLARTTLHLAVYLLDSFMDNFTIRPDKLNLTALTGLMVAAKIEEADVDMPKFATLNELIGNNYSLTEFKSVESKILTTFNFDLLRPTAATFAEYFANNCLTLDDYHIYVRNWHSGALDYHKEQLTHSLLLHPLYTSYEEMVLALNKIMFGLVDMSLNYFKFANVRPSILAAACIAAVRQMQNVLPIWTSYLVDLTKCTSDVIAPYVDAIMALHKLCATNDSCKEDRAAVSLPTLTSVLCDSPDSGIGLSSATKSDHSSAEDSSDADEDDPYHCVEYPVLAKRRRLF